MKKELAKHRKLKFAQGILKNQCFKFTKILKDILVVACGIRTLYLIDFASGTSKFGKFSFSYETGTFHFLVFCDIIKEVSKNSKRNSSFAITGHADCCKYTAFDEKSVQ